MTVGPRHVAPEILSKITKALGITALDQWYYVPQKAVTQAVGSRVLNEFGGTIGFLKAAYPLHQFDEEKLIPKSQEREQKFIEVIIRKLFPNTEIHTKARKAVGIVNPKTNAYLEIDFWIPSLKLGIEYQDKHHYEYQWYANAALEEYQERDSIKKVTMPTLGYTLITIGYWWDKTLESLVATIRKFRPDLLQEYEITAEPIPSDPPSSNFTEVSAIPGVAGLMSPFIPSNDFDPTNWYAGEKHDGVRGVYNSELNKLFSRSGKELSILPSLLNDIPSMLLEGEITAGHGNYNKTAAVSCHTHYDKVNWPAFRYVIFDIPNSNLGNYTRRYSEIISGLLARPFIFSLVAFRVLLANKGHLTALLDSILNDAGEGVIVQQDAQYEYGRAKSLAKIKLRRDADAQVLSINKHSCTCKLVSGITTDIIFSDGFDPNTLTAGDIVSYYHNGYSQSGKPKQAEIYKVRYDLPWEKLAVDEWQSPVKRRSVKEALGGRSLTSFNTRNKIGFWNKSQNARTFFDGFARTHGFDSLVPENWYMVARSTLRNAGGGSLLQAYNYNFKKALTNAYPELKFDLKQFRTCKTKGHWNESLNAREFFDKYALTHGFDPLVPENWYPIRRIELRNAGGGSLLHAHKYSFKAALTHAYPEVKFNTAKFRTMKSMKRNHWNKSQNVRAFFDEFARTSGFNPLVPDNWYSVRTIDLRSAKSGGLLKFYGYSLMKALKCAYPEMKFESQRFRIRITKRGRNYWTKALNIRAFFDNLAQKSKFNPLLPENWYPINAYNVRNAGGSGLLDAYSYNVSKALAIAYPELKFEESHFRTRKTKGKT